jgi:hypothetical protein
MRMRAVLGALGAGVLSMSAGARDARACGGCFHEPSQNGDVITDHRMIFRVTPQATTLYDEIEYQGDPQSFAWVLPIHGPVTVGLSSDIVFAALDSATQTTIVAPNLPACPTCSCGPQAGAASGSSSGGGGEDAGVNVISQSVVGPYDTVQLSSTNPNALAQWLQANGYVIPQQVQPVLSAYVNEGFDFLAMRLAPGQGVQAMRPVRVTSSGAGLSLPLRMVAAGTGATVGITLWVVADGRYEPKNFPSFQIDPAELTWDFSTQSSDYTTIRAQKEAARNNAAWQIESSLELSPYSIESRVLSDPADADYEAVPASDAGADGGGAGESADQVRADDLATLFPGGSQASVRVTRMRADLSHAALASDLVLQASADQSELPNVYQVQKYVNAPSCPAVPTPCPPCGDGSGSSSGGGGMTVTTVGPGHQSFSCDAAGAGTDTPSWFELAFELAMAAFLGAAVLRPRKRARSG